MKFAYGKNQKINEIDLDKLFDELKKILDSYPNLIKDFDLQEIVTEWINDILFLNGYAELDEVKPVDIDEKEP